MNADAEIDALVLRHPGIPLDHAVLHLDRAAHGVDDAAELDQSAIACALDDAPSMDGNGRVDQVAAQRPQPCQNAIFVGAGETGISNHIGRQNCSQLAIFAHLQSPSGQDHSRPELKWRGVFCRLRITPQDRDNTGREEATGLQ